MEPKDTDFLTYGDYTAVREVQDKAIKREFVKVHGHLESHDGEFAKVHDHLASHDGEFAKVHDHLASHDREFAKVHDHLASHDREFAEVHREFAKVHDHLASHDGEFAKVRNLIAELQVDIRRSEAVSHNAQLRNPIRPIRPVPTYRPGRGMVMPDRFPKNPKAFIRLMYPSAQDQEMLEYLVNFYDIQGHESWVLDDDDRDEGGDSGRVDQLVDEDASSTDGNMSLEEATRKYPKKAAEALGAILGLDTDHFLNLPIMATLFSITGRKRAASMEGASRPRQKRVVVGRRVPPPPDPEQKVTHQPEVTRQPEAKSFRSKSSMQTWVGWDTNKDKKRGPTLRHPHGSESDPSQKPVAQPAPDELEGSPTNPFTSVSERS